MHLVVPALEMPKIAALPFEVSAFPYGEDPVTWEAIFRKALVTVGSAGARIGVEPRRLRLLELRLLEAAAPKAEFVSAENAIASVRMTKDEYELAAMQEAVDVAQRALLAVLPGIRPGITERQLGAELTIEILRAGSSSELPFSPIVAFGANSANPHAKPTDKPLEAGEVILLDWGANVRGYCSDLTRTFVIGEPDPEMSRIAEVVSQANSKGISAAKPGASASAVDRAARSVIDLAGYGQHFIHRTGHGLGLEAHEDPFIRADNPMILTQGMTFTVEPGIYLPDRGGIRIEDDVMVTLHGGESMSDLPRGLVRLDAYSK